jgi:glycosyltransferase involved in cell wall biosynthesis
MNDVLVTVITPVYNGSKFIAETISSVLSQNFIQFEYIVVNDGSTDNTIDILQTFISDTTSNLTVINQANQGEAISINNALKIAKGKYFCVVCADDPVLPGFLDVMTKAMENSVNAVVAYPDWLMIDENSKIIRKIRTLPYSQKTLIADCCCIPGPGAVIRRSAIHNNFFRNPKYRFTSDFASFLELSLHGEFVRVPLFLAQWRQHPEQATKVASGHLFSIEIQMAISDFFANNPLPYEIKKMKRRAISFSRYYAGIQKMHDLTIPGRKLMLSSIMMSPPHPVRRQTDARSALAVVYVLLPNKIIMLIRYLLKFAKHHNVLSTNN